MFKKYLVFTAWATAALAATSHAQILDATSREISLQARLTDAAGDPLPDGPHRLDLFFYTGPLAPVPVASVLNVGVITANGVMAARIGPLDPAIFTGNARWVGMTVDDIDDNPVGDELSPRIPFGAVPYAFRVDRVENAELTDNVELGDSATAGSMTVHASGARRSCGVLGAGFVPCAPRPSNSTPCGSPGGGRVRQRPGEKNPAILNPRARGVHLTCGHGTAEIKNQRHGRPRAPRLGARAGGRGVDS